MVKSRGIWAVACLLSLFLLAVRSSPAVAAIASENQVTGPSFSCPAPRDPLAQLICETPALWRVDLAFVQTYQALRQQLEPAGQQTLRQESLDFGLSVRSSCGIALAQSANVKGPTPPPAPSGAAACVSQAYERQKIAWQSRVNGATAEEAARPIESQIAAQRALQRLGFLAQTEAADGVFGPATRAAIINWQSSAGRNATGLLDNMDAQLLGQAGPTAALADEDLQRAAMQEDAQAVRAVLSSGTVDYSRDTFGATALKRAVGVGHHSVAAWLLRLGADPNIRDNSGATSLDSAAYLGDGAMVQTFLSANARFWSEDRKSVLSGSERDLFIAVSIGSLAGTRSALQNGANAKARDSAGATPLHFAAALATTDIAELLLAHGAEVDARSNIGTTPLMVASYNVAELLLAIGADIDARNNYGLTSLHFSALYGRKAVLDLLLAHGANASASTTFGQTPMAVAQNAQYSVYPATRGQVIPSLQAAVSGQIPSLTAQQAEREHQIKARIEAAVQALREARRQDLVTRFGPDADAVMAGEVHHGMTEEAVLAARGAPHTKKVIPPAYEIWVYDPIRIAFTDGKVTHVGH